MSRRVLALLAFGTVATAWIVALAVESAARMISSATASLGAELPSLTLFAIALVKSHLPGMLAAAATIALAVLWFKASPWFLHANAALGLILAVLGALAAIALALPFSICGDIWPAWNEKTAAQAKPAATAQAPAAPRSSPSRSCF